MYFGIDVGGFVLLRGDYPGGWIGEEAADELGVERVASFSGFDASEEWQADKREIANQVEGFVAAEFVGETQRAIHHAVFGEHDGVVERAAANQSHGA